MYRDGLGVAEDYSAAIACFRRAAELGDEDSWDALRDMGNEGLGNVGNYEDERAYYDAASREGLPRWNKGYGNNYGCDYDSALFRYYSQPTKRNDPRAVYNLGMLYLEGRGVEKNLTQALSFLEKAEQIGNAQAKHQLDRLLNSDDRDMASQALALYLKAAKQNKTWALLALGHLYVNGTALAQQDRLRGWVYMKDLVNMKEYANLIAADQSRIAEAESLLGKLKWKFENRGYETREHATREGIPYLENDVL
jgi:hypothetical protein